ncbi:methyltransferase [Christiangramia fulva]|uniref:Methyltransferase n=1 Tax=Christiangramia fulva TaxID=2126553 RepID=A0A2R3Z6K0_9FLAO|nr:class I SAM-dependent methyltransferase [Christiangramia fulva]AVR45911.1 methyltransferase [Christiangramia fulva]
MLCSLCNAGTRKFEIFQKREFLQCTNCKAILLHFKNYLSPETEKARYKLHENDVEDEGYIRFVQPLVERIIQDFPNTSRGLDFGCGTGPVATTELKKQGFEISLYDPYFMPDPQVLKSKYDFIFCSEVMEHFHKPASEFALLKSLLKDQGKIYCKTSLWNENIDFETWYYKNDPTHVIFYHSESLHWIKEKFRFRKLEILPNLIVFEN